MIPRTVHFIYFCEAEFPLYGYLAVKSAQTYLRPDKINFYRGRNEPLLRGEWWDKASKLVELVMVDPPTEVLGRPLRHPAHQADVFRLRILIEIGGIYLDLDTICRKPFDDLLKYECVLGHQTKDEAYGLCNAVILARPDSRFLRSWLEAYSSFRSTGRDEYWDEHSVKLPLRLAQDFLKEGSPCVRMEPQASFFDPGYSMEELRRLFERREEFPNAYCHHLWSSYSYNRYLKRLSPSVIRAVETSYNLLCRPLLDG